MRTASPALRTRFLACSGPVGRAALALLTALAVLGHAPTAHAQDALPPAVLQALAQAGVPADALAAVALPLARQGLPFKFHAQRPMQPGSTMKLVTSIVALDHLGPNVRGSTRLLSNAPVQGDTLAGDLVLQGGADPELDLPAFWSLLLELRQQGVQHIAGRLLVDRTAWLPARPDQGVLPFDEAPEFPYNVIPDALNLAGSLLTIEMSAQRAADGTERVQARTLPALDGVTISSGMTLDDTRCADWDDGWLPAQTTVAADGHITITLNGRFPRGCTRRAALQLMDRQLLTERLFATLWRGLGGTWSGQALEAPGPADARVLVEREGRPWGEVLRGLNKRSDNAHARTLFNTLGVAEAARAAADSTAAPAALPTREWATRSVLRWMADHHIDSTGLVLDNGSGLSRSERISPLQMARMLESAYAGQQAPELLMSLPVAGVDGTLRNRLRTGPATGWARLKTGTLRNVVALAGVVRDPQGRPWAVAFMVNDERASRARPALDALVNWVAEGGALDYMGVIGP
jgi:serine-type D-Ala-D-Ala carboxypeptidase/endopeptidase (penicillin-binding protein 4)